jgi:hypothetical protein
LFGLYAIISLGASPLVGFRGAPYGLDGMDTNYRNFLLQHCHDPSGNDIVGAEISIIRTKGLSAYGNYPWRQTVCRSFKFGLYSSGFSSNHTTVAMDSLSGFSRLGLGTVTLGLGLV